MIELPAPATPSTYPVISPTTAPVAYSRSIRAGPSVRSARKASAASVSRLKTVPNRPPSWTTSAVTSRHHWPPAMAAGSRMSAGSSPGTANWSRLGTAVTATTAMEARGTLDMAPSVPAPTAHRSVRAVPT